MTGEVPRGGRLAHVPRSPMFWILLVSMLLRLPGLSWGLPASDGWDDDGVAPRNFLVGLAQTYAPGAYFAYPPLHMVWLAILTAPGLLMALLRVPALTQQAVVAEFIQVPYMTFFAVVARLLSLVMSMATIYLVGRMTETAAGRRAGLYAAAACALDAPLVYYGQVTNLDTPYIFWSALALWAWMRVIAQHQPRHLRWVALAAVAAVATKDQAYAVFLIALPASALLWALLDGWVRRNAAALVGPLLLWTALAALALLVIDGAIINPSGFAKRLAFLTGPASRDYAEYDASLMGRIRLLADMCAYSLRFYPAIVAGLIPFGLVLAAIRQGGGQALRAAGLVPAFAALSFTLAFNCVALRSENRFLLPQSVLLAPYIGMAVEWLVDRPQPRMRSALRGVLLAIAVTALYQCAGIDAALINDPRYDAERWMAANIRGGDTIEAYGLNAYLPRFPAQAIVTRLDGNPLSRRNPLPGVAEVAAPFDQVVQRKPQFLVVNDFWVRNYLRGGMAATEDGRKTQRVTEAVLRDKSGRAYFNALFAGSLPYRLAHESRYSPGIWPRVEGYESLTQRVFLFERIHDEAWP